MKLKWHLETGFVGSLSYEVNIDDSEIEDCETEAEYNELIASYVQDDFNNRISFNYDAPPFIKKINPENEDY